MRVAVMGSGGVGGFYGALLARAGHNVTFVARGPHLRAICERGLTVRGVEGTFTVRAPATDDPASVGQVDLVLLAVKAYDSALALEQVKAMVGPGTLVLSVQNGVENGQEMARVLGRDHVLEGCVYIAAAIKEPGVIAQAGGSLRVFIGEPDGGLSERCRLLEHTLREAGWHVQLSENVHRELWRKLAFVGPMATVCSLARLTLGGIRQNQETVALLRDAVAEVVEVGNGQGADLPADTLDKVMTSVVGMPPGTTPSMLRDALNGKPIEVEALVGSVVRLGQKAAVRVPVHEVLYALLLPLAQGQAR